jgi:hypothetical protein
MKNTLLLKSLAGGLLLVAGTAYAQDRDPDQDRDRGYDTYHHQRDDFYRGDRWRARMFDKVRADLDHAQSVSFPIGRDEYRIVKTKTELGELQTKLDNHQYDQPELDDAIAALSRVVSDNRLSPRDRDMLNDDLNRLREYREHHENWGR